MDLLIVILTILGTFAGSLSNIFDNYIITKIGTTASNLISRFFSVILFGIIFIILHIYKKPIGPMFNSENITKMGLFYSLIAGFLSTINALLLGLAFYYNFKSSNPLNIGILTGLISISFVFTIIISEITNILNNKPITFSKKQAFGVSSIIIGVIILSFL